MTPEQTINRVMVKVEHFQILSARGIGYQTMDDTIQAHAAVRRAVAQAVCDVLEEVRQQPACMRISEALAAWESLAEAAPDA